MKLIKQLLIKQIHRKITLGQNIFNLQEFLIQQPQQHRVLQNQPTQLAFQDISNPYQYALNQLLKKFNLQSIQQITNIALDPQLSNLFKCKFPQTFPPSTELTEKLKKLSIEHTYNQMYIYYEQFPLYLKQCRQVLKYKYQQDDILRTHHNRKSIWLLCSGALAKIKENPAMYQKLSNYRSQYPQFYRHTIQKDVVRTIHQQNSESQQALSSILRNLSIRNPYVGYCQGMNFIVNFLILMQFTEQQAFWITTELIENWLPKTYYTNMMGVAVDICLVEHYVRLHYPALRQKLQQMNLSLSLFVLQWLVCLFTSTLPFYMLVIVWDMMFIHGPSVLLRVCIVILTELQPIILHTDEISELLLKIQQRKKSIFIEQDRFIARINAIFIDQELIPLCRELIQMELMVEKVEAGEKVKRKDPKKLPQIQCDIEWPICYRALKQHKSDMGEIQVWTFKEQGAFKPIPDYLTLRAKKSHKLIQDNRPDSKKLVIGRIPHTCDITSYNKKHHQAQSGLQLQDFDLQNRKKLIQSLFVWGNKISVGSEHLNFFKTTTRENLTLLKEETQKVRAMSFDEKKGQNKKSKEEGEKRLRETELHQQPKLQRGSKVEEDLQTQTKMSSQKQITQQTQAQDLQKTRNPFKKLRNKWRQRKGRNQQ